MNDTENQFATCEFKALKKKCDEDPFVFGLVKVRKWHFHFTLKKSCPTKLYPQLYISQCLESTTMPKEIYWKQCSEWDFKSFETENLSQWQKGTIKNLSISRCSYIKRKHTWFSIGLEDSKGQVVARSPPFKTRARKLKPSDDSEPRQRNRQKTTVPVIKKVRGKKRARCENDTVLPVAKRQSMGPSEKTNNPTAVAQPPSPTAFVEPVQLYQQRQGDQSDFTNFNTEISSWVGEQESMLLADLLPICNTPEFLPSSQCAFSLPTASPQTLVNDL